MTVVVVAAARAAGSEKALVGLSELHHLISKLKKACSSLVCTVSWSFLLLPCFPESESESFFESPEMMSFSNLFGSLEPLEPPASDSY